MQQWTVLLEVVRPSARLSDCLKLCPSRCGIVSKDSSLSSKFFNHLIAAIIILLFGHLSALRNSDGINHNGCMTMESSSWVINSFAKFIVRLLKWLPSAARQILWNYRHSECKSSDDDVHMSLKVIGMRRVHQNVDNIAPIVVEIQGNDVGITGVTSDSSYPSSSAVYIDSAVIKSLFHGTGSVPMDVGHLPLLARLSGTLCPRTCVIRMFLRTVTGSHWRRFYFRSTSVFSALEVYLRECAI